MSAEFIRGVREELTNIQKECDSLCERLKHRSSISPAVRNDLGTIAGSLGCVCSVLIRIVDDGSAGTQRAHAMSNESRKSPHKRYQVVLEAMMLEAEIPPAPWQADIDDPGTTNECFTGKFHHPECPHTASVLYDDPKLARQIAEMRNLFPRLLDIVRVAGEIPCGVCHHHLVIHEGQVCEFPGCDCRGFVL